METHPAPHRALRSLDGGWDAHRATGVVGTWVVAPIRRAATELLVRVLAFIHDQT